MGGDGWFTKYLCCKLLHTLCGILAHFVSRHWENWGLGAIDTAGPMHRVMAGKQTTFYSRPLVPLNCNLLKCMLQYILAAVPALFPTHLICPACSMIFNLLESTLGELDAELYCKICQESPVYRAACTECHAQSKSPTSNPFVSLRNFYPVFPTRSLVWH